MIDNRHYTKDDRLASMVNRQWSMVSFPMNALAATVVHIFLRMREMLRPSVVAEKIMDAMKGFRERSAEIFSLLFGQQKQSTEIFSSLRGQQESSGGKFILLRGQQESSEEIFTLLYGQQEASAALFPLLCVRQASSEEIFIPLVHRGDAATNYKHQILNHINLKTK
jgi:hypothetical protein